MKHATGCGGTHGAATGEIGLFRFLSESSVASAAAGAPRWPPPAGASRRSLTPCWPTCRRLSETDWKADSAPEALACCGRYFALDPEVMTGKPVIRGTRLTVGYVLNLLAHGATEEEIMNEYDGLAREDIRVCLLFGARSLSESSFMPLAAA